MKKGSRFLLLTGGMIGLFGAALAPSIYIFAKGKTNVSQDQQNVNKINSLIAQHGEFSSMRELVEHLLEKNIDIEQLTTKVENGQYVWDDDAQKVFIMDGEGKVAVAPAGYVLNQDKSRIWKMVTVDQNTNKLLSYTNNQVYSDEFEKECDYSQYLRKTSVITGALDFATNIDTGLVTNLELNLVKKDSGETADKPVVVVTNGSNLNVSSCSFTSIDHSGSLLNLELHGTQEFTTSGKIAGDVVLKEGFSGNFTVEKGADVNTILVSTDNVFCIKVESDKVGTIAATNDDALTAMKKDGAIKIAEEVVQKPEIEKEKTVDEPTGDELSGLGTEKSPYVLTCADHFAKMHTLCATEYKYFKFENTNKVIDGSFWEQKDKYGDLYGSFDGNGLIVNNLTRPLFRTVGEWDSTQTGEKVNVIKNVTVNCNMFMDKRDVYHNAAGIIRNCGDRVTLENINVHGTIVAGCYAGGFICFGTGNLDPQWQDRTKVAQWTLTNCHCDATIGTTFEQDDASRPSGRTSNSYAGGLIAYQFNDCTEDKSLVTLNDTYFDGIIFHPNDMYSTGENYAYFSGGTEYHSMRVKTNYSAEFVRAHGNLEGTYYNTPVKEEDGSFHVGKNIQGYENNIHDGYLVANKRQKIVEVDDTEPDTKGQPITVNKIDGCNRAVAMLCIRPKPATASIPSDLIDTFLTENLTDVSGSTLTTDLVRNYKIQVNNAEVQEQGVHGDTYDVFDRDPQHPETAVTYGTDYTDAFVFIVQYKKNSSGIEVPAQIDRITLSR